MKKTAVVFGSNAACAIGCCINIMALEKKSPDLADKYIVYYDLWDEELIRRLKAFSDKVKLIEFTYEMYEKKYVSDDIKNSETYKKFIGRYSHFSNLHSEYLMLLKDYNQVIYMDADFIVLDDISELKEIDTVAWRGGAAVDKYKGQELDRPNGGLFIFPDSVPYESISKDYLEYFLNSGSNELAIDRLMYDYGIEVKGLSADYNFGAHLPNLMRISEKIKIFHSVGSAKIWNSEFLRCLFPEYIEYLEYFDFNCMRNPDESVYSRDDFIKSLLISKGVLGIPQIDVYNPHIHLNAQNRQWEVRYGYKDYVHIFFRVRRTAFDTFRIYFQVDNETKIKIFEYISNSKKCLISEKSEYRYHEYDVNKKTYYKDCNKEQLEQEFNKMTAVYTEIVDEFLELSDVSSPSRLDGISDSIEHAAHSNNKLLDELERTKNELQNRLELLSDKITEINKITSERDKLENENKDLREEKARLNSESIVLNNKLENSAKEYLVLKNDSENSIKELADKIDKKKQELENSTKEYLLFKNNTESKIKTLTLEKERLSNESDIKIKELTEKLNSAISQKNDFELQAKIYSDEINELNKQVVQYENSRSWKITKPLRSILWFFIKIFKK